MFLGHEPRNRSEKSNSDNPRDQAADQEAQNFKPFTVFVIQK